MQAGLAASPDIQYYLQYVASLNLGYRVEERAALRLPAYAGPLRLTHAAVPGAIPSPTPTEGHP